jgi:hypothetical protein
MMKGREFVCLLTMVGVLSAAVAMGQDKPAPGGKAPRPASVSALAQSTPPGPGCAIVSLPGTAGDALRNATGALRLERFPVGDGERTLNLERFEVLAPGAEVVVGRPGGKWEKIATPRLAFWRGTVEGAPDSSVFIGAGEGLTVGSIDLGAGGERYRLSSVAAPGRALPAGTVAEFKVGEGAPERGAAGGAVGGAAPLTPGVFCGVAPSESEVKAALAELARGDGLADGGEEGEGGGERGGTGVARRLRVQLAVDTDYEFYTLFNDVNAAAAYVVVLYAQVSAIYLREIKVGVELSFVRIWDTDSDPYNVDGDSLLGRFQNVWQTTMGSVTRDLAQLASGRRDLAYGGIAYVNGVCNSSSYSVVGYLLGRFPDPSVPNAEGYDIMVTAHEIGHNFGTLHTHDYGIDHCDQITTPARRGSIMSYCSQTVSGGNANMDLRFETSLRTIMRNYLRNRTCVDRDCNGNGVPDPQDIASGTSLDVNHNNVPDECEDCNGNGRFDALDISLHFSLDLNGNGIPDDCEPDCNGNGVPDDLDIANGTSADVYLDGVPDECQTDCDGNGVADYNQIQANMTLDLDRNRVLDSCQDCDGDGTNDLMALRGSRDLWVTSSEHPEVFDFYATTGVKVRTATSAGMLAGQDVVITPDRRVLVSSGEDDRIVEFDRTGAFVRTFAQGGPLDFPAGMALTGSGTLLVVSRNNSSVLEYDLASGSLVRTLVAPGSGGLAEPFAIVIAPSGQVLVSMDNSSVLRYDGATGAFLGVTVAAGAGGLDTPRGLLVKADGHLLVTSLVTYQVLEYDLATGAFIGQWNHNGTASVLRLLGPWGIRFGPDGNVYVAVNGNQGPQEFEPPPFFSPPQLHVTNTKVFRFDARNGNFLTSFVIGQDTGLEHPAGLAFMPLDAEVDCNADQYPDSCEIAQGLVPDCNGNGVPDSCDIASGFATDYNGNGVPDSCECLADWNHDGVVNSTDVSDFINDWFEDQVGGTHVTDFNHDGVSNSTDVSDFINAYFGGTGKCG